MQLQIDVVDDLPVRWATWRRHDQAGVLFRTDVLDLDREAVVAGLRAALASVDAPLEPAAPIDLMPEFAPPELSDFWERYPQVQLFG